MISYRQADLLDSFANNPIGLILRFVPDTKVRDEVIVRETINKSTNTKGVETTYLSASIGEFLGSRDGYAFYTRPVTKLNPIDKRLWVQDEDGRNYLGIIESIKDGYYGLVDGTRLKSEEYNQVSQDDNKLIVKKV